MVPCVYARPHAVHGRALLVSEEGSVTVPSTRSPPLSTPDKREPPGREGRGIKGEGESSRLIPISTMEGRRDCQTSPSSRTPGALSQSLQKERAGPTTAAPTRQTAWTRGGRRRESVRRTWRAAGGDGRKAAAQSGNKAGRGPGAAEGAAEGPRPLSGQCESRAGDPATPWCAWRDRRADAAYGTSS